MAVEDDDEDLTMEEAGGEEDSTRVAVPAAGVNNIREMLDDVEEGVDRLRKAAQELANEKENLHTVLDMLVQPEQLEALGLSTMEK
jgi:hypothetical protein